MHHIGEVRTNQRRAMVLWPLAILLAALLGCCRSSGSVGDFRGQDAGTCQIGDSGAVSAGTWLEADLGSCTVCAPQLNASGWTTLAAGATCEGMALVSTEPNALLTPFSGRCSTSILAPYSTCSANLGGQACGDEAGCVGGTCTDAGWCESNHNVPFIPACGIHGSTQENSCAEGPCCVDAGSVDTYPYTAGWCCGLIDGGVDACLPSGSVCYDSSNCCAGTSCVGLTSVFRMRWLPGEDTVIYGPPFASDSGYGFCVPN
jgi:hypothetical protein